MNARVRLHFAHACGSLTNLFTACRDLPVRTVGHLSHGGGGRETDCVIVDLAADATLEEVAAAKDALSRRGLTLAREDTAPQ